MDDAVLMSLAIIEDPQLDRLPVPRSADRHEDIVISDHGHRIAIGMQDVIVMNAVAAGRAEDADGG